VLLKLQTYSVDRVFTSDVLDELEDSVCSGNGK